MRELGREFLEHVHGREPPLALLVLPLNRLVLAERHEPDEVVAIAQAACVPDDRLRHAGLCDKLRLAPEPAATTDVEVVSQHVDGVPFAGREGFVQRQADDVLFRVPGDDLRLAVENRHARLAVETNNHQVGPLDEVVHEALLLQHFPLELMQTVLKSLQVAARHNRCPTSQMLLNMPRGSRARAAVVRAVCSPRVGRAPWAMRPSRKRSPALLNLNCSKLRHERPGG